MFTGQADSLNVVNTLAMLGNLASSLQNTGNEGTKRSPTNGGDNINVLDLIGNIAGALQNTGQKEGAGIDTAGLLQGLGGILGSGQAGEGSFDASTIGSLINMIAQTQETGDTKKIEEPKKPKNVKKATATKKSSPKKTAKKDDGFDLSQILSLAQNFLGGQGGQTGRGKQQSLIILYDYIIFLGIFLFNSFPH